MDTDGHGYQMLTDGMRLSQRMSEVCNPKSVSIRVHPWFMTSSYGSDCGISADGRWHWLKRQERGHLPTLRVCSGTKFYWP